MINFEDSLENYTYIDNYEGFIIQGPQYDSVFLFRQFVLPVICVLGETGNVLSAMIFFGSKFRNTSCNLYLAARSVCDIGFVITLFLTWFDFIHHNVFNNDGLCQLLLFLSSICSFLSVWFVLFVTIENYIRLCRPSKVLVFCNTTVAKFVILIGVSIAVSLYNFPLWGVKVQMIYGKKFCMTLDKYVNYEKITIFVDTLITLIVPVSIIIVMLVLTLIQFVKDSKPVCPLQGLSRYENEHFKRRNCCYRNVTRLLTAVSVTFVILHTPNHVIRLKVVTENLTGVKTMATDNERTLQQIFITMYYLNFSVNCLVYLLCGKRFRKQIFKMFRKHRLCVITRQNRQFNQHS